MLVSVVMATFNEERYIREAVEALQAQTHAEWELIAVDDASADSTPRLLEEYAAADPRIRILRNDTNRGLAASLNRGLQQAKGELVARVDPDDANMPDRFAKQVAYLREHADVDVLGTGATLIDMENGQFLGVAVRPSSHEELVAKILKEIPFLHSGVMARRRFFEAMNGYDEKLRRAQDFDLWYRGRTKFRYANLPEPLIRCRVKTKRPMKSVFYAAYAKARLLAREGKLLTHGWFVVRPVIAAVVSRLGLREVRWR